MPPKPINRFLVVHEYTCPECNGERYHCNPQWEEAIKACNAAEAHERLLQTVGSDADRFAIDAAVTRVGTEAMRQYWANQGYGRDENRWPPEELCCNRCEGDGIIHEDIPLAEALAALGREEVDS